VINFLEINRFKKNVKDSSKIPATGGSLLKGILANNTPRRAKPLKASTTSILNVVVVDLKECILFDKFRFYQSFIDGFIKIKPKFSERLI